MNAMLRRRAIALDGPLGVETAEEQPIAKVGHLDVDGHRRHLERTGEFLHVFLDGEDVTQRCVEADTAGWALVFEGKSHRKTFIQGNVRIVAGEKPTSRERPRFPNNRVLHE